MKKQAKTDYSSRGRWFSFPLYRDFLARRRIAALVISVIVLLIIAFTFAHGIHDKNYQNIYRTPDFEKYYASEPASPDDILIVQEKVDIITVEILLALIPIISPVFVFIAFACLRSRRECDFTFALPYTKREIFFSYTAGAVTLPVVLAIGLCLLEILFYSFVPGIALPYTRLFEVTAASVIASLQLAALALLAVTLTGTLFSALVSFGMFAFYPSVLRATMNNTLSRQFDIYDSRRIVPLLADRCLDAPIWLFKRVSNESSPYVYDSITGFGTIALWSLFVSVLLITVSYAVFVRRDDCVGSPAISRPVQHCLRAFAVTPLAADFVMIAERISFYQMMGYNADGTCDVIKVNNSGTIRELIYLVLIIAAVYFVYEAVTVRRPRTLLAAVPAFAAVIVFGLAFWGTVEAATAIYLNYCPSDDEIAEICIDQELFKHINVQTREYVTARSVIVTDPGDIARVTEGIRLKQRSNKRRLALCRTGKYSDYGLPKGYVAQNLIIRLKSGITLYMAVPMKDVKENGVNFIFTVDDELSSRLLEMPPLDEITSLSVEKNNKIDPYCDIKSPTEFYRSFLSEYEQLSTSSKKKIKDSVYYVLDNHYDAHDYAEINSYIVTIEGMLNGQKYTNSFAITREMMPETWNKLRNNLI
ncbi:MAG: hypothetical protein KBT31_02440 [Firmicutes bacterium]|nr:hypothetical protein [Candidatus Colimorpha enterica]